MADEPQLSIDPEDHLPPFDPESESWKNMTDDEKNQFMVERGRIRTRRIKKFVLIAIEAAAKDHPENTVLRDTLTEMLEEILDLERRTEKPPFGL